MLYLHCLLKYLSIDSKNNSVFATQWINKMDQQVNLPSEEPDHLTSILGPPWWKERREKTLLQVVSSP